MRPLHPQGTHFRPLKLIHYQISGSPSAGTAHCQQDGIGECRRTVLVHYNSHFKRVYFTRSGPMRFPLTASSTAQTRCCYHRNTSKCGGSSCMQRCQPPYNNSIHSYNCVCASAGWHNRHRPVYGLPHRIMILIMIAECGRPFAGWVWASISKHSCSCFKITVVTAWCCRASKACNHPPEIHCARVGSLQASSLPGAPGQHTALRSSL